MYFEPLCTSAAFSIERCSIQPVDISMENYSKMPKINKYKKF
jgi:hypothetical protein